MFTSIPEKYWPLHKNVSILKNETKILDDCRQHLKSDIFQPLHCNVISWGAEIVDCFPFKNETRVYKSRGAIVKSISRLDILSNSNSFNFIFLLEQIVQAA